MEPRGRLRHRWANRKVENGREHMSQSTGCERVSRPSGSVNDLTFQRFTTAKPKCQMLWSRMELTGSAT